MAAFGENRLQKRTRREPTDAQRRAGAAALQRRPNLLNESLNKESVMLVLNHMSLDCSDVVRYAMTSKTNAQWVTARLPQLYGELRRRNPHFLPPLGGAAITLADYSRVCAIVKIAHRYGFQRRVTETLPELLHLLHAEYDDTRVSGMRWFPNTPKNHARQVYHRVVNDRQTRSNREMIEGGLPPDIDLTNNDVMRSSALQEAMTKVGVAGGSPAFAAMLMALSTPGRYTPYFDETSDDVIDLRSVDESLIENAHKYSTAYAAAGGHDLQTDLALAASSSLDDEQVRQFRLDGGDMEAWRVLLYIKSKEHARRAAKTFGVLKQIMPNADNIRVAAVAEKRAFANVQDELLPLFAIPQGHQHNTADKILSVLDENLYTSNTQDLDDLTPLTLLGDILRAGISLHRVTRVMEIYHDIAEGEDMVYGEGMGEVFSVVASVMLEASQTPAYATMTDRDLAVITFQSVL
jgi:hypothetical protein